MSSFADYCDTFDEVTWEEMEAALSEAESAPPLTPNEQLEILFPLPPVSVQRPPVVNFTVTESAQSPSAMFMIKDEPLHDNSSSSTPIAPSSASYSSAWLDAQLDEEDVLHVVPARLHRVSPSILTQTATSRPVSSPLYNASPVLPMPDGVMPTTALPIATTTTTTTPSHAARLSRTVSAPDATGGRTATAAKPKRAHSQTYSPVASESALVARTEKRRRRTESRDLHPRPRPLASPARPLVVPSNAHISHIRIRPPPSPSQSGPVSPLYPAVLSSMPTPPANPAVSFDCVPTTPMPHPPQCGIVARESESPKGQMVWPGIYFST